MTKKKKPEDLLPRGAPPRMADGQHITVYLDAETIAKARKLGDGNVSEGIRRKFSES